MPKISIKKKSLIIIFLSLFFLVCLIIAFFLSNFLVRADNSSESVKSNSFELHLLSLSKSKLEKEALAISGDYQKIGAGGFVWKDGEYYHVVSSAYANKNDAILVQNSIKTNQSIDSEIISIKFEEKQILGTFTSEETKVLTKALNSYQEYYLNIYDISISLDTAFYNEISARLAVNNSHNNLATTIANFETLFNDNISSPIKSLTTSLNNAKKSSQALCGGYLINQGQTYSSILKYRYLEVLYNFYNLSF